MKKKNITWSSYSTRQKGPHWFKTVNNRRDDALSRDRLPDSLASQSAEIFLQIYISDACSIHVMPRSLHPDWGKNVCMDSISVCWCSYQYVSVMSIQYVSVMFLSVCWCSESIC